MHRLDVIVPVYNGARFIKRFMESLDVAAFKFQKQLRLIVIDNGSTDTTQRLLNKYIPRHIESQINFFNEKVGSYASRNYAMRFAKSDLVLFTDIDCYFDEDFFERLLTQKFEDTCFYGGKIHIPIEDKTNAWEVLDSGSSMKNERLRFVCACLIMKKSVFLDVGPFKESTSGADIEWSDRASKMGLKPIFLADLVLNHPSRKTFQEIRIKYSRIAYGVGSLRWRKGVIRYLSGLGLAFARTLFLPRMDLRFRDVALLDYCLFRIGFLWLRFLQIAIYISVPFGIYRAQTFRS